jgi:hypothetical protein
MVQPTSRKKVIVDPVEKALADIENQLEVEKELIDI